MSLAEYLAKNYLTADPGTEERPKKKRKRTTTKKENKSKVNNEESGGLIIADDDAPDFQKRDMDDNDDEDNPALLVTSGGGGGGGQFRRAKKSNWKTVSSTPSIGGGGGGERKDDNEYNEQDEAEAIIASAAAENATKRGKNEEEDAPAIASVDVEGPRMESGARAGLQTAEETAKMVKIQEQERKAEAAEYKSSGQATLAQETIYRDASGRIINVAMMRAKARREEQEQKEKEELARQDLMGDVQRKQLEDRKVQLHEAKAMPLARSADDQALNDELRGRMRWDDPAAQFLTGGAGGPRVSATGKPLYKGSFQPNRYGIPPGHRWDGVDRANGFEKEWFASRNRRGRLEALEYEWQMDEY